MRVRGNSLRGSYLLKWPNAAKGKAQFPTESDSHQGATTISPSRPSAILESSPTEVTLSQFSTLPLGLYYSLELETRKCEP